MSSLKSIRQRLRNRLFRLFNDREVVENCGVKLWTRDPAVSDRMFFAMARQYERTEADFATRHIRPESRILEVGAGVGFVACHCARNIGVRHHALVEANPQLLELIAKNLELNGASHIPLINAAVAATDGEITFTVSDEFWASSTAHSQGRSITVRAASIPTLLAGLDFKPDTLIIDIEGGEIDLPIQHLALFDAILMETHPGIVGEPATAAMLEALKAAGFVLREERSHVVFLSRN